jgi:hypothetical protein
VERFTPRLAYDGEWQVQARDDCPGQMLAVGPPGEERFYVANPRAGAVQRFTPDGTLEWWLAGRFPR